MSQGYVSVVEMNDQTDSLDVKKFLPHTYTYLIPKNP